MWQLVHPQFKWPFPARRKWGSPTERHKAAAGFSQQREFLRVIPRRLAFIWVERGRREPSVCGGKEAFIQSLLYFHPSYMTQLWCDGIQSSRLPVLPVLFVNDGGETRARQKQTEERLN